MSTDSDIRIAAPANDGKVAKYQNNSDKYACLHRSPVFSRLRSRSRRYLMSIVMLLLGTFTITVVISGWMPAVFETRLFGHVNLGFLVAVCLILLPALVTAIHLRYVGRRLDPLAERVREEFEKETTVAVATSRRASQSS